MSSSVRSTIEDDGEIDLTAIWQVVWTHRWLISAITLVGGLVALALALTATPIYRAEVVVVHVNNDGMGGGGSLSSQLGGLAGLVGVNLGAASGPNQEAHAVLVSRRLVEEFIRRYKLLSELLPKEKEPMLWFGVQRFRDGALSIREDETDGTTHVAVDWTDAVVAARWANDFVALANEIIRTRAMDDSKRNISYLTEQIARTNVVEVQRVMYNLIESETKSLMVANGRIEYAFTVVDPAVPPQIRIRPRRTVMVLLGVVLGMFVGIAAAFSRQSYVQPKRAAQRTA